MQNRSCKFPLTDTRVAAVHAPPFFHETPAHPQCTQPPIMHLASCSHQQQFEWDIVSWLCLLKWLRRLKTLLRSTKSVCGAWRICPGVHMAIECCGQMLVRTGRFSSTYSLTRLWPLNFLLQRTMQCDSCG